MNLATAMGWAVDRKHAVLVTIRRDGRPQSSDIVYTIEDGSFVISLTDNRAKTRNLLRDPRAVLHISEPSTWSYLSFDGTVDLLPVTTGPTDATSDALVAYYEAAAGHPHPDWAEYRQAMIDEKRLIARFTPVGVVGQLN